MERGPLYHHLSHGGENMCNTGFYVMRPGLNALAGNSLCLQIKGQCSHVCCSAAVLDKVQSKDHMADWWGAAPRQRPMVK